MCLAIITVGTSLLMAQKYEHYSSKVLIEEKYGDKTNEFGFTMIEGDIFPIVTKIEIDSMGNIYLLDKVNNRIKKYNNDGEYINSIPIQSFQKKWFYDDKGPLIGSPDKYNTDICIDSKNNLYVLNIAKNGKREIGVFKNSKNLEKTITIEKEKIKSISINDDDNLNIVEEVGNQRQLFEVKSSTEIRVFKGIRKDKNGNTFLPMESISKNKWRIPIIDMNRKNKEILVESDKNISSVEYLRRDDKGNIYIRGGVSFILGGVSFVYKYSPQLKLLAKINGYDGKKETFYQSKMIADNNGNIYQLVVEYPKMMIIKWEKKK